MYSGLRLFDLVLTNAAHTFATCRLNNCNMLTGGHLKNCSSLPDSTNCMELLHQIFNNPTDFLISSWCNSSCWLWFLKSYHIQYHSWLAESLPLSVDWHDKAICGDNPKIFHIWSACILCEWPSALEFIPPALAQIVCRPSAHGARLISLSKLRNAEWRIMINGGSRGSSRLFKGICYVPLCTHFCN